jgi:capsular polysaccharide transport system permease protein
MRVFNVWLWLFVFIPTLLAGVYYFGIASDLYLSEAKFVVRTESRAPTSLFGSLLQGTGLVQSSEDTFSVQDFIMSRDAVRQLENNDYLREIFDRPGADFLTRFPNRFTGSSFEALFRHYADFVNVTYDSSTGVSTLRVKAYRPEDAQAIARALLIYSEALVNTLNERAEEDALETARHEVARAEQQLADIQGQLTAYRSREQMLDPKTTSSGIYDTLKQITAARTTTETLLAEQLKDSPNSPQIPALRTRLEALNKQVADARAQIAGDGDSVVAKLTEYERLALQRELAEKSLASATSSIEAARVEARRQHLYIEHIVQPNLADYPLYPKRMVSFLVVFAICLIAYGIAWLLIASVREHAAA